MWQGDSDRDLHFRWSIRLYIWTVITFLLVAVGSFVSMLVVSSWFARAAVMTGVAAILASLTLLLRDAVIPFYDRIAQRREYESAKHDQEVRVDRLVRLASENPSQFEAALKIYREFGLPEFYTNSLLKKQSGNQDAVYGLKRRRSIASAKKESTLD